MIAIITSETSFFRDCVRLNRFHFMGGLFTPVAFVEGEGMKSQQLGIVVRDSMVNPVYDFILN